MIGLLAHGTFGRAVDSCLGTHGAVAVPHRNLANAGVGLVKDQLHVGPIRQWHLANGTVHLVYLARNAHVAQERYVAFADEFDDIA
ncbi:hypothetical protein DXA64_08765 [Collinsella sp. OF03-4AA]|nr:hypothetical protein DXA64_08765 [Collinsella sp. OF03-4AA]